MISKIDHNEAAIKRWRTKLKRAMSTLEKLERQRKRLLTAAARPPVAQTPQVAKMPPVEKTPPVASAPPVEAKSDKLDIPGFLRRQDPDPGIAQVKAEQAETKRRKARGRIEK